MEVDARTAISHSEVKMVGSEAMEDDPGRGGIEELLKSCRKISHLRIEMR